MPILHRFGILLVMTILSIGNSCLAQDSSGTNAQTTPTTHSYTTITSLTITPLSNGVQISIAADGILQFQNSYLNGKTMIISFPDARNGMGKNFFQSKNYPVSYIQLSTPQGAVNGIGLTMQINNFVSTSASMTATPDSQGVLITVQSDRTIEPSRRHAANTDLSPDSKPDTSTEVQFANNLVSLRAVRADIHSLIGAIAQKTGLSVAVDDAVDRKVSIYLQNVDPATALQSIATAYGLALSKINGISMMSEGVPTDLATYHLSGTQSYRMQNTQAQTASGLLPNFLYSYVKVNSEQNAVVVTAPSQMLAKIGADLTKVDVPSPQILIEAVAVELTDTASLNLGLTLSYQGKKSFSSIDGPNGGITYNTIGLLPRDFEAKQTRWIFLQRPLELILPT